MPRHLVFGVHEVYDPRRRRLVLAAEHAIAQPEVERRASHDHQVRFAERERPGAGDEQLVPTGQNPAALAIGDHGDAQRLGGLPRRLLGAAEPDIGSEHHDRALRVA